MEKEELTPKEKELKPYLTDEFLSTLKEAVRVCGWMVDHIESSQFVGWCFEQAGKEYPRSEELEPYSEGIKDIIENGEVRHG